MVVLRSSLGALVLQVPVVQNRLSVLADSQLPLQAAAGHAHVAAKISVQTSLSWCHKCHLTSDQSKTDKGRHFFPPGLGDLQPLDRELPLLRRGARILHRLPPVRPQERQRLVKIGRPTRRRNTSLEIVVQVQLESELAGWVRSGVHE